MHGLNFLLPRYSQLLVLRILHHAEEPLSGREIERRTGLSNRATMMALDSLAAVYAVHGEAVGNARLYQLNPNNYFINKAIRPAFEAEDLFWTDFRKTVRRHIHPRPIAAIVTGPLARDEDAINTRVQLTLLFSTGRNRIRAFSSLDALHDAVSSRYAVTIDPVLLDVNNMDADKHEPLWRRVEREGILLFGTLP